MSLATHGWHDRRGPIRILVADADADTRSLYGEALQSAGCDVVDAADGRDALVSALAHPPTLVITETWLPVFDGCALCELLRRDSMTRTVPILVVTGETRPAELNRARAAGADAILIKPVALDGLLNEIERLLERPLEGPPREQFVRSNPTAQSADLLPRPRKARPRRMTLARGHLHGQTTTPPAPPPSLHCPVCDRQLVYERSYIGGVSSRHPEQWDDYRCPGSCGGFEYRQRTRSLRRVARDVKSVNTRISAPPLSGGS
jgi:CheY-like chemotaxis protein